MKKIILLLTGLFICSGVVSYARYVSRMTQDGTLFFIEPKKLNVVSNIKKFEYDMTLLSWSDSITLNFTFESNLMSLPEQFYISADGNQFICNDFKDLYIDIKNKKYEIRITSKFSAEEIQKILSSQEPPVFCLKQDEIWGHASYKKGTWKKDQKKLLDIYNLYLYSKQRAYETQKITFNYIFNSCWL